MPELPDVTVCVKALAGRVVTTPSARRCARKEVSGQLRYAFTEQGSRFFVVVLVRTTTVAPIRDSRGGAWIIVRLGSLRYSP